MYQPLLYGEDHFIKSGPYCNSMETTCNVTHNFIAEKNATSFYHAKMINRAGSWLKTVDLLVEVQSGEYSSCLDMF